MFKRLTKILRREPDYSPEFRERLNMIVGRARAEKVGPNRFATFVGPDGPLPEGAATLWAQFMDRRMTEEESA